MKKIILLALVVLIAACVSPMPEPPGGVVVSDTGGYGTLADAGNPVEMSAAVVYTSLAIYRHKASALLRKKRITVDDAIAVQRYCDAVRAELEDAVREADIAKITQLGKQLHDSQIKFNEVRK